MGVTFGIDFVSQETKQKGPLHIKCSLPGDNPISPPVPSPKRYDTKPLVSASGLMPRTGEKIMDNPAEGWLPDPI